MSEYVGGSPELGGMPGTIGGFAPANFLDAEDTRPIGAVFDIGGHGSSTPYSDAMNSVITKHMEEIKNKTAATLNLPSSWKKRLREFVAVKNNDLLDFLKLSVTSHPVLGPGEVLLRRFGNPNVTPNHPSVREFVMDVSGEDVIAELNAALETYRGEGGIRDYANATRLIYEEYRTAGDAVLKAQAAVKAKLDRLDRIQGKISHLFEIETNEKWPPLMEATEAYLEKIFSESQLEPDYKALIAAYRRFAALRDVMQMSRALVGQENEPICTICLQDQVNFAIVPCGHTYCQTCIRRQGNACPVCRGPIKDRLKLYFG